MKEVKFESEIAVVIGKPGFQVKETEALDIVFGYTIGNDVTAPLFFHPEGHWTLGKSLPTFTPLGPWIDTELKMAEVRVRSELNGKNMQDSPTSCMILKIPEVISKLSEFVKLMPGDVILTGAPAGADYIRDGDVIECFVTGLGSLRNSVRTGSLLND